MNGSDRESRWGTGDAVETAALGVVRVEGRRRLPASGVMWSPEGVVVTAHHVVKRDEGIGVGLADGRVLEAAIVGRDPTTDLAVLRVAETSLPVPTWRGHDGLRTGDVVLAVGRPGAAPEATIGVVSALGGAWTTGAGGVIDPYLRTDVLMYPGFSGGALADESGSVLGLVSSALSSGASLAIPTATVGRVVAALLEHGRIRRGYLGVTTQPVRLPEALAATGGRGRGLLVAAVEPGSPAAAAGVLLGDVLLTLDDLALEHVDDLLGQLAGDRVGSDLRLRVLRGGAPAELTVTIGERPR